MIYEGIILNDLYQILSKVGSGGTGDVYLAYHLRLRKYVVVKKIKDNFVGHVNVRTEVDILKNLKHTFLPQVYDFVQLGTTVYTVMDYIDGYDMEEYIKSGIFVDEVTIIKWLEQMCEVLDYLHNQEHPIIHSDIKPANIRITSNGDICLIDFNISLDGDDNSQITGITLPYASPEQFEKAMLFQSHMNHQMITLDGRSDMYSTAASFYYLMTGYQPAPPNGQKILLRDWNLSYSEGLVNIIDRAMAFDVNSRYGSMKEMQKALHSIYKNTRKYKIYFFGTIFSSVIYLCVIGLGIWCLLRGSELKLNERYYADKKAIYKLYSQGDYSGTINSGNSFLNNYDYKNILRNNAGDRIEILHTVGESCFELENYLYALDYYAEAVQYIKDIAYYSGYYRDYIVTLVRCGYIEEAQNTLDYVKDRGILSADIKLVETEILVYNGEFDLALTNIDELSAENISNEYLIHIFLLGSEVAEKTKQYERQIAYLEKIREIDETISVLRKLGNAYMLFAVKGDLNHYKIEDYYSKAAGCYEILYDKSYASENDGLNLAICYRAMGKLKKSLNVLHSLEEKYKDYRIYMQLAFTYDKYDDASRARTYTLKAVNEYNNTADQDKESSGSDNIVSLMELEKKYR